MSKKILMVVLSLVMVMTLVVGCGNNTPAPTTAAPTTQAGGGETTPEPTTSLAYPEDDIEVVYHSKAGSGGDIFLRTMGKALEPALGVSWVVNNMPGASGATAFEYAANADPDGYTLLGVSSTIITAPLIAGMTTTYEDFEPVCMMFTDPMVIFVQEDSPFQTLKDIVDFGKANPGSIKFAGGTPGELGFVVGAELMRVAGFEMALVPFEGGGDAAVSVLGGHVDGGIGEYAEIASSVEAGKLRIIASLNAMPELPDVPTFASEGYPEIQIEKFRGVLAPKGTPQEVIDKLAEMMKTAFDDPDFQQYIKANNMIPNYKAGAEFTAIMKAQHEQVKSTLE